MVNKRKIEEPGSALEQGSEEEAGADEATETSAEEAAALAALTVEIVDQPLLPAYTPHSTSERPQTALPDASEVDPSKIPSMVLTKQGWVLPTSLEERAKN